MVVEDDDRNGKRKRVLEEDSDSGMSVEGGGGELRVGKAFQAVIPPLLDEKVRVENVPEKAICLWKPCSDICDDKLEEYVNIAREKSGYGLEQALGLLLWHNHDVDRAISDLMNFLPYPEHWSAEDKVLFEQAFSFHGKNFTRIKQMLPDKTIGQLVRYYYSWKKTRYRSSYVDRMALKGKASDSEDSEESDDDTPVASEFSKASSCLNCNAPVPSSQVAKKGSLCVACFQHWRETGQMREVPDDEGGGGSGGGGGGARRRGVGAFDSRILKGKKCPRGINIIQDDLDLFSTRDREGDNIMTEMTQRIAKLKHQVQLNKQIISALKPNMKTGVDEYKLPEQSKQKPCYKWTQEEVTLGLQGIRRYGKNFPAIADVLRNKTEAHVRSFYQNYREKYKLDLLVDEHERDYKQKKAEQDQIIDVLDDDANERGCVDAS